VIRFDNVHKAFGENEVLRGFTLEVKEGETMVIIGYSGTGKSVAIKHIVGLLEPDEGEVWVDGLRVDALSVGGPIAPGVTVEVVGVQGAALVVRVGDVLGAAVVPGISAVPESPALSATLESFDFDQLGRQPLDSPPDPDQS